MAGSSHLRSFDAIIVGSGVTGGVAAKELCEAGLSVLVLEAGPSTFAPEPRKSAIQSRCYAFSQATSRYFVDDEDDPYCTPDEQPFSWIRARALGGKSLLWAGHCYRMGDLEFKAASRDGFDEDWPISYLELAPYYSKAEKLLCVRGLRDGLIEVPDGDHRPAEPLMHHEERLRRAFFKLGRKTIRARVSHREFQAETATPCIHCGQISSACARPVASPGSTLALAAKTRRLTLWTDSPVRSIITDASGKATGVCAVDAKTRLDFEVRGRLIFLCASTLESTRILLNSTSALFPQGLGNSSGVLGRYLMDHVSGIAASGIFMNDAALQDRVGAGMLYLPRWQNLESFKGPFLRGYGCQIHTLRADHDLLPCCRTESTTRRRPDNAVMVKLNFFGEMLPYHDNYVEIDKEGRADSCGIPILRIVCRLKENETAMANDMARSAVDMLEAAGAKEITIRNVPSEPGLAIHEAGTCRIGVNPKTSVLNGFNQCHDSPNVFVTDGSSFPSAGAQNPVLTMAALTIRACEQAVKQMKADEL